MVEEVAKKIAGIKQVSTQKVMDQTTKNAQILFSI
jgi:Tat protein secretion system quality control protein TatD with DNase activity